MAIQSQSTYELVGKQPVLPAYDVPGVFVVKATKMFGF